MASDNAASDADSRGSLLVDFTRTEWKARSALEKEFWAHENLLHRENMPAVGWFG
jgi:hypothetical protein